MAAVIGRRFMQLCKLSSNIRPRLQTGISACQVRHTSQTEEDVSHMKTTVNFLTKEQEGEIFLDAYSNMGFRLNNGIRIMGPLAIFPRSVLHWNVAGVESINEESFSLFTVLEPKIDILVVGVGEKENMSKINPEMIKYLRSKKINVEILPTAQALSTFNFLNSEKRYVAAALIPPSYIEFSDDDMPQLSIDASTLHGDYMDASQDDSPGELSDIIDEGKIRDRRERDPDIGPLWEDRRERDPDAGPPIEEGESDKKGPTPPPKEK